MNDWRRKVLANALDVKTGATVYVVGPIDSNRLCVYSSRNANRARRLG